MKIQLIENLLPDKEFNRLREEVKLAFENDEMDYCHDFKRYHQHRNWYADAIHRGIVFNIAKEYLGKDIIPSYSFISLYNRQDSNCKLHKDRFPMCQYTLDLCLWQNEPWDIFVNLKPYKLEPNQALLYSGTGHIHHRGAIKQGNEVCLSFFHFSDSVYAGRNLN